MQITVYPVFPGHGAFGSCYTCRTTPQDMTWVDTGIDIVGEGGLVLCADCVGALGESVGMVAASRVKRIKEDNKKLRAEHEGLAEKANLFDNLAALVNMGNGSPDAA